MDEVSALSNTIPHYKSENESLRERLTNIRHWAEMASKLRYKGDADADAVCANLITQILTETDKLNELKPVEKAKDITDVSDELFQILQQSHAVEMEEALKGFDFYEENPYRKTAEKKIAKMEKKRKKEKK